MLTAIRSLEHDTKIRKGLITKAKRKHKITTGQINRMKQGCLYNLKKSIFYQFYMKMHKNNIKNGVLCQ